MSYIDIDALPILLVDDEAAILRSLSFALRTSGLANVHAIEDSRTVMPYLAQHGAGVILLDLTMPHVSGQTLLKQISERFPDIPVIVMTAVNDLSTAVDCMKAGAIDYLLKPFETERLVVAVRRGIERRVMRADLIHLKESLLGNAPAQHEAFAEIVTQDKKMLAMFRYVETIAKSPEPVLITGESGTGKSVLARVIHKLSGRPGELVEVNVAGINDEMFNDVLFGHVKGGFTGAVGKRVGKVAMTGRGTLFLDEIGDLAKPSQVKLLELLQDGTFEAMGDDSKQRSQARIIAATNRDLRKMVAEGSFRTDLYYRLDIHQVDIPPLRERKGDLPLLLPQLISKAAEENGKATPTTPPALLSLLQGHDWPGNVRELDKLCLDAVARHPGGVLSTQSFRDKIGNRPAAGDIEDHIASAAITFPDPLPTIDQATEALIDEALRRVDGNQTIAAPMLGLSRAALNVRLARRKKDRQSSNKD